jgi:hypothetical protein
VAFPTGDISRLSEINQDPLNVQMLMNGNANKLPKVQRKEEKEEEEEEEWQCIVHI